MTRTQLLCRLAFLGLAGMPLPAVAAIIPAGGAHGSIQLAIKKAAPGDTVQVQPGHYREGNLVVDKRLTLQGVGLPVLDGQHKYEVLGIKADSVTVEGFKVIACGRSTLDDIAGIKLYNIRYAVIQNNVLDDNIFGIYSQHSSACTIRGNRIRSNARSEQSGGNGIHCWKCDDMRVIQNQISGHRDGIYFEFVTNSIIWRNQSTGNFRYGLHFMFSHNDSYISNVFAGNGAGVAVMFTKGIKMYNNFFEDNWGESAYGLLLKEISDSHLEGNTFFRNTIGIHMEGSSRIQIRRNLFKSNGYAIRIQGSCEDDTLVQNAFRGNTFDIGSNSSLSRNFFRYNYWDKYEGYDLARDGTGDVPYHPVSLFSTVVETTPAAMMLFRSFMVTLLDKSEKMMPSITPANLKDDAPAMKSPLYSPQ